MRLAVKGKLSANADKLKQRILDCGYKLDSKRPDIVISYGGDGSLLHSERQYPGIPKLAIRDKSLCLRCNRTGLEEILRRLSQAKYRIKEHAKAEAVIRKRDKVLKRIAANDIVIRNREPYHALRFNVFVDGKKLAGYYRGAFVGDGIIVATSFGSTGYFSSACRKRFKKGIGLAFNNPTRSQKPIVKPDPVFRIEIVRNDAHVCTDNDKRLILIAEGDSVEIRKSAERMRRIII